MSGGSRLRAGRGEALGQGNGVLVAFFFSFVFGIVWTVLLRVSGRRVREVVKGTIREDS